MYAIRSYYELFPYLERKGFTGPSKVMWGKHDEIRAAFRELDGARGSANAKAYRAKARDLARRVRARITSYNVCYTKLLRPHGISSI